MTTPRLAAASRSMRESSDGRSADLGVPFKMVVNLNASSQRVLKLARLTNMKTGQILLGKGNKGSLTVLGASSTNLNNTLSSLEDV